MRSTLLLFTAGAVLVLAAGTAHANLLTNGNLDLIKPTEVVPGFFLPKPHDWTYEGSRTITGPYQDGLSSESWAGPAPTPVTTDGFLNNEPNYPQYADNGDYGVFFKCFSGNTTTDGPATVHLYQDVPATPGDTYTLTGWAGGEANFYGLAEFAVEFLDAGGAVIGGDVLDLLSAGLLTDNGEPFFYKQYTVTADAPVGTVAVRARASMLSAIANPAGGGQAYVVDDFVLTPEPASILLLLPAFALLRRR